MIGLLIAALIVFPGAGHHYGWARPHNPHHRPPCAVVFHLGCASDNPPPVGPFPRPTL
jgi:hypothetical protein